MSHIKKKFELPGLHVSFAKKERTDLLNGLFKEHELRGLLEVKDVYEGDMVFVICGGVY